MGIMDRHRRTPIGDRLPFLEGMLEMGGCPVGKISLLDPAIEKTGCPDCDEEVYRIKWRDQTFDVVIAGARYVIHQCPDPVADWQRDEGDL